VYAVILNWNSYQETLALVEQLKLVDYPHLAVIVVDNHSTLDNSAEHLQAAVAEQGFELICNDTNLGYAGGNNTGINAALERGADYVWILNPDIRVENNALEKMLETASSSQEIAATGSRICFRTDMDLIFTDGGMVFPEKGYLVKHLHNKMRLPLKDDQAVYAVDYANGSSMLLNAKALQAIGTFREDFFLYFEEAEWCLRAKKAGWQICTDARAVVYHSPSTKGANYHFYMTRNRIWLARLDKNKQNYRATVALEKDKILTFFKKDIIGSLKFRLKVGWAKLRGLYSGILGKLSDQP
jgi:GT2 family glycosyltransferase